MIEWGGNIRMNFKDYIIIVFDWLKLGIIFKDILILMDNGDVYCVVMDEIVKYVNDK